MQGIFPSDTCLPRRKIVIIVTTDFARECNLHGTMIQIRGAILTCVQKQNWLYNEQEQQGWLKHARTALTAVIADICPVLDRYPNPCAS